MAEKEIPVKKEKLSQGVMERMRMKIRSGEWKAGERLPAERTMAELFGVSRTVLREAIRELTKEQELEIRDGGTYVCALSFGEMIEHVGKTIVPDEELILEIIEVRQALERQIAREAAKTWNGAYKEALLNSISRMEALVQEGESVQKEDHQFHELLAKAAGNEALGSLYHMCLMLMESFEFRTMRESRRKGIGTESVKEHRNILNAVVNHDALEAMRLMKNHGQFMSKIYRSGVRNNKM